MDPISRRRTTYNRYINKEIDKSFKNRHENCPKRYKSRDYYKVSIRRFKRTRKRLQHTIQNEFYEYCYVNNIKEYNTRYNPNVENKSHFKSSQQYPIWYPNSKSKKKQNKRKHRARGTRYDGANVRRVTRHYKSFEESFEKPYTYCNILINELYNKSNRTNIKNTTIKEGGKYNDGKQHCDIFGFYGMGRYRNGNPYMYKCSKSCYVPRNKLNKDNYFKLKMEIQKTVCYRDYIYQQKQEKILEKKEKELLRINNIRNTFDFNVNVTLEFIDGCKDSYSKTHKLQFGNVLLCHNSNEYNRDLINNNLIEIVKCNVNNKSTMIYCSMWNNEKLIYLANLMYEQRATQIGFKFDNIIWNGNSNSINVEYNTLFKLLCELFDTFVPKVILRIILEYTNMEYFYYFTVHITGKVVATKPMYLDVNGLYQKYQNEITSRNLKTSRMYGINYGISKYDYKSVHYCAGTKMDFERVLSNQELGVDIESDDDEYDMEQMRRICEMFDLSSDSD